MANTRITNLGEDTTPADGDLVATVDVSDTTQSAQGSTKKVQAQNLVVKKLRTSTGPAVLTVGAVVDGEFLKRSGTAIISEAVSGGISGLTTGTIPKAASATTLNDSQISQTATDVIVTSRDLKTRSVYSDTVSTLNYNLHSNNGLRLGSDVPGFGFTDAYIDNIGRHAGFLSIVSTGSGGAGTFAHIPHTRAQFTANQNNLDIPENYWLRWSSDASRDITGMRNETSDPFSGRQADGETHLITNVGAQNIVLKNQDANSTDVNRYLSSTGADITLAPDQSADTIYDATTQRWRVYKRN